MLYNLYQTNLDCFKRKVQTIQFYTLSFFHQCLQRAKNYCLVTRLVLSEISGNAHLQPLNLHPLSSERQPSVPSATGGHPTASVQNLISWPYWYSQFEQD